jgi:hypothetical protein
MPLLTYLWLVDPYITGPNPSLVTAPPLTVTIHQQGWVVAKGFPSFSMILSQAGSFPCRLQSSNMGLTLWTAAKNCLKRRAYEYGSSLQLENFSGNRPHSVLLAAGRSESRRRLEELREKEEFGTAKTRGSALVLRVHSSCGRNCESSSRSRTLGLDCPSRSDHMAQTGIMPKN